MRPFCGMGTPSLARPAAYSIAANTILRFAMIFKSSTVIIGEGVGTGAGAGLQVLIYCVNSAQFESGPCSTIHSEKRVPAFASVKLAAYSAPVTQRCRTPKYIPNACE